MMRTEDELIRAISGGDADALSKFYDLHSRLIYSISLKILQDTDDAEQVVHEVFLLIWAKASTYNAELGSPKNWITRLAHCHASKFVPSRYLSPAKTEKKECRVNTAMTHELLNA